MNFAFRNTLYIIYTIYIVYKFLEKPGIIEKYFVLILTIYHILTYLLVFLSVFVYMLTYVLSIFNRYIDC